MQNIGQAFLEPRFKIISVQCPKMYPTGTQSASPFKAVYTHARSEAWLDTIEM